jgi:hypothetical protein
MFMFDLIFNNYFVTDTLCTDQVTNTKIIQNYLHMSDSYNTTQVMRYGVCQASNDKRTKKDSVIPNMIWLLKSSID